MKLDRISAARKAIRPAGLAVALGLLLIAGRVQADWLQLGRDLFTSLSGNQQSELGTAEIGKGLREALKVGTERVVVQLGRKDGFNNDPAIHIPLPEKMETVKEVLARFGYAGMLDELELRLNRAAESATPRAKELFWQAIADMTMEDAMAIYKGPQDAATRYFEGRMRTPLAESLRPVVEESLAQAGAVRSFDAVMGKYRSLPFVSEVKTDLTGYVVDKALAGIFLYLAKEEAAIRRDPAKRTTELLQQVFGAR
jgi:hypothetical protein